MDVVKRVVGKFFTTLRDKIAFGLPWHTQGTNNSNPSLNMVDFSSNSALTTAKFKIPSNFISEKPFWNSSFYFWNKFGNSVFHKPTTTLNTLQHSNFSTDVNKETSNVNNGTGTEQGILVGTSSFKKLVFESTVIVDKSLLIKEFLEDKGDAILSTYPRRCGKSINLDMIKSFLEIEVDINGVLLEDDKRKNKKLFFGNNDALKALKISTAEIKVIEEGKQVKRYASDYFGKFPVVYVDFKVAKGENYQQIEGGVKTAIHKSFCEHTYLLKSNKINNDEKAKLDSYISEMKYEQLSFEEMRMGLEFLCKMLHMHHNKKVYVLVDEYDAPINHIFKKVDEGELSKVLSLFRTINEATFKTDANAAEYLAKGFITGILRIAKADLFSGLNNLVEYNVLSEKYAHYYGFTQSEVNCLFNRYNVPRDLAEDIKDWYNGYKVGKHDIYNIWAIVNCLKNFQDYKYKDDIVELKRLAIKSYWEKSGNIEFIEDLFKHSEIGKRIQQLANGDSIIVNLGDLKITSRDFQILKKSMGGNFEIINDQFYDLFFSYLFLSGYLTIDKYVSENIYTLRLPNKEIKAELNNKLLVYYKQQYTVDPKLFTNVTDKLSDFFNKKDIESEKREFKKTFEELLNAIPKFINIKIPNDIGIHGNEDVVHSLLNYIALQIKTLSCFGTEIWYKKEARADIMLVNKKSSQAMVIELKYDKDVNKAGEQVKKYSKHFQKYENIKDIIYLAVNVSADKTVTIVSYIENNPYYNPSGKGTMEIIEDDSHILPFHEKFCEYYSKGMEEILSLRIKQLDEEVQNKVKLVSPKHQLNQAINSKELVNALLDVNLQEGELALIPYNIEANHWTGLIFSKGNQGFKLIYLDPENKTIPQMLVRELAQSFSSKCYNFMVEQENVQQQKFNNCGSEVIEGFVYHLTGSRLSQGEAIVFHSHLVEHFLLAEPKELSVEHEVEILAECSGMNN